MLVIFDFDGTLADTWDWLAEELVANSGPFKYRQVDRAELEGLRRLETKAIFRTLGVSRWRLPSLVAHLRRRATELANQIELFPGMRDVVIALHDDGHTLCVASSNAEVTIRRVLGPDLAARFRYYACSSSVFGKAAKFRKLCRRTGIDSSAIISVGDETRDLDAAKDAGIAGIAVTWGYNDPALLRARAPDRTAETPVELFALLMRFAAGDHSNVGEHPGKIP